jgi:hypothetical protein
MCEAGVEDDEDHRFRQPSRFRLYARNFSRTNSLMDRFSWRRERFRFGQYLRRERDRDDFHPATGVMKTSEEGSVSLSLQPETGDSQYLTADKGVLVLIS